MIIPRLSGERLLADIEAARLDRRGFHLWWLGQSGFLLQWQGRHLLMDPYLSDSLTLKYAETDKPHVRMTEQVIDPQQLNFIDVVTSSHNHTDHLDAETLLPLMQVNPQMSVLVPAANREFAAARLECPETRLTTLDAGESREIAGFEFLGVPAAHEQLDRDAAGRYPYLGYVVRFGEWSLYHSGDTVLYDGLVEQLRPWAVTVALLPINGRLPARRVAGNLWGAEAAELACDIGAGLVIPCHFEMFEFNTVNTEQFVAAAEGLKQPYRVLACGQRWSGPAVS